MQGLLRRPPDDSDHKLLTKDEAHWWRSAGFPPAPDSGYLDAANLTCTARGKRSTPKRHNPPEARRDRGVSS